MQRIYLDYAATAPVDPAVMRSMTPYFSKKFGNPGSLHAFGQEAIAAVDKARETIAKSIGAGFREVIFTGSATEANNFALRGIVKGVRVLGLGYRGWKKKTLYPIPYTLRPRIVISAVEHESVRGTAHDLEKEGVEVVGVPVDRNGILNLAALRASLNNRTVLVSVMYANNEIGTIQPIAEIVKIIKGFRVLGLGSRGYPLFHTDAAQAFQYLDCDVVKLGVDMLTLSAHKIYGPKGVGVLYIGDRVLGLGFSKNGKKSGLYPSPYTLAPSVTGGGQEFGLRSGTENVPGIVGFAEAARAAAAIRKKESARIRALREELWKGIKKICPDAEVNGIENSKLTLPSILNVYFPGRSAQELLMRLDIAGIAASAGPACSSRAAAPSHVVQALGHSKKRASESVRFSMGKHTTREEIHEAVRIIADATAP